MRNGAKEFLSYPLKLEEFLAALDRIRQSATGSAGEGHIGSSQVVTIAGVNGGVGCTSLAINLACSIAQNARNSVTVIDLDLALGDADVWLDIIPDFTIQDVAENITRLDYSLLKRSLTKHDCGAYLLPRPTQLDETTSINPEQFRRVIALLKATFTHLVIDVSKEFGPLDMAAMEVADTILLITQLDLPCLRNVVRLLQYFEQQEGLSEKIKIIVNRFGLDANQISSAKALETIGRDIYWQLPNEYAVIIESRNNGIPLMMQSPKAKLTKAIEQLAGSIDHSRSDAIETEESKPRKGLFSFLASGSK
jgi:pilus assembly protein CpaE